ncbi:MAG: 30S ribosomal protein S8 [Berkelbacteria bacterium GW2011_GWB1_38_5]|uniref:Small ribosomal subunit protein uS8 n=2 Tax=Candidatus Berkelbacteria TaxID=1618330 RepID=A0A0G0NYM2_9BACT|nr:MAG: 30S ribosomal protein S8 [Berkelbacteria bacterium GW2011_GWB1_38_5]KKQ90964.1 MAG: 30S ribosomal protein S8 [Berkelbacteria bacterium GW2011_GWA1_39_10]
MDPIAQMFTNILNAKNADQKKLTVQFSKLKMGILSILKEHGYVDDFKENKIDKFTYIEIKLRDINKLNGIRRISRPGRRYYATSSRIPLLKGSRGIIIISTSQGLMNGEDARKKGLGGEVIAEVN